ncbi:hypothetical protein ACFPOE_18935 [Caenimonas terrae]|uniref:Uncharacterized protein n=1 Tax=Caenimonas terrae TaxID=696074 RepID=A0ABW0NGU8_9BURK
MKVASLLAVCIAVSFGPGASAQTRAAADYIRVLEDAGYPLALLKAAPFSKGRGWATTFLYKVQGDKNPLVFFANVSREKNGAEIFFKVFRDCVPSDARVNPPQKHVIMVSSRKIQATSVCVGAPGKETQDIFTIDSEEGSSFIKKEFADKEAANDMVFVQLHDLPVPFLPEGFSKALTEASGKAL